MPGSTYGAGGLSTLHLEDVWARTEENRLKLADLERCSQNAQKQLADLTTEVQTGIKKLQTDFGRLRSESRFARAIQTNHSPTSGSQMGRHSTTGASTPASSTALCGSVTTPDTSRAAYPGSCTSVPERAAAVLSSSTVRLDALEAACEDLRLNVQEMASVPEATAELVRGEMSTAVAHLREEIHAERSRTQHNTTSIIRVEAITIEVKQALADFEHRLIMVQRDQSAELGACRKELEATKQRCEDTVHSSGALQASLQLCEQRCLQADELQASWAAGLREEMAEIQGKMELEHTKGQHQMWEISQAQVQSYDLAQRLSASERQLSEILERQRDQLEQTVSVQGRLEATNGRMEEQASRADFVHSLLQEERRVRSAELEALRRQVLKAEQASQNLPEDGLQRRLESLEDACRDMSHRISKCSQRQEERESPARRDLGQELQQLRADVELLKVEQSRQTEDTDRTSGEGRQDHSGSAAVSHEQLEELVAKALEWHLCAALAPQGEAGESFGGGTPASRSPFSLLIGHLDSREAARCGSLTAELAALRERLEGVERLRSTQEERHRAVAEAAAEATSSGESEGVLKLQAALADCSGDVASLAKEIAQVRMAHDHAFSTLGGLPSLIAEAAAASVERTQEMLAAEFAARKEELTQAAAAQHKALRERAEALAKWMSAAVGETADVDSSGPRSSTASRPDLAQRTALTGAPEAKRLHAMLESCVGQMEALAINLQDMQPRVQALETVIAARDCWSPTQPAAPGPSGAAARADGTAGRGQENKAQELLKQVLSTLGGLAREGAAAAEALDAATSKGPCSPRSSTGQSSPPHCSRRPPLALSRNCSPLAGVAAGGPGLAEERSADLGSTSDSSLAARGFTWKNVPVLSADDSRGHVGGSLQVPPARPRHNSQDPAPAGGSHAEEARRVASSSPPPSASQDHPMRSMGASTGSLGIQPASGSVSVACSPPPPAKDHLVRSIGASTGGLAIQPASGSVPVAGSPPAPAKADSLSAAAGRSPALPPQRLQGAGGAKAAAWAAPRGGGLGARDGRHSPSPTGFPRSPTSSFSASPKQGDYRSMPPRPMPQVRGSSPDSNASSSAFALPGNRPVVRPPLKALGQR